MEEIFNNIVNECANGSVDCYFSYNIIFSTYFLEDNKYIKSSGLCDNLVIPTLVIKNKEKFYELLKNYLIIAKEHYSEADFPSEIRDNDKLVEKTILTLLWSNATLYDFENPEQFLEKRISFFKKLDIKNDFYSEILNANVTLTIKKTKIYSETQYFLETTISNDEDLYKLPNIYFGVHDNKLYIYAIQNDVYTNKTTFNKKINRHLYKLNDNFDLINNDYENYLDGNTKDVSLNFVYALFYALRYFSQNFDITEIDIPTFLPSRWNAKEIAFYNKFKFFENYDIKSAQQKHVYIQTNLTEKLVRNARRLSEQVDGIWLKSIPDNPYLDFEFSISKSLVTNNKLLEEIISNYTSRR